MDLDELKELFSDMLNKGLRPMLCDADVPFYDTKVPCGNPAECGDDSVERLFLPRELLSKHPEFAIAVTGDSMKDAGIIPGDRVRVTCGVAPFDGDIVLASIDDEYTLKVFYKDDEGRKWLVPQNERYKPVLLDGKTKVRVLGTVSEVIKRAPRVETRLCRKLVRSALEEKTKSRSISLKEAEEAVRKIAPKVKKGRHWFAVYRALADKSVVSAGDFDGFCALVVRVVPDHDHLPVADEMQRMNDGCFKKSLNLWTEEKAPVKNKHYKLYLSIGVEMTRLLEEKA